MPRPISIGVTIPEKKPAVLRRGVTEIQQGFPSYRSWSMLIDGERCWADATALRMHRGPDHGLATRFDLEGELFAASVAAGKLPPSAFPAHDGSLAFEDHAIFHPRPDHNRAPGHPLPENLQPGPTVRIRPLGRRSLSAQRATTRQPAPALFQ